MYKKKKIILFLITIIYGLLFILELINYFKFKSTLFGVLYLIIDLLIIFLLIPVAYNYKRTYSKNRISKLIIIILLCAFNSYFLDKLLLSNMNYIDNSADYISSIYYIKTILKGILLFIMTFFTIIESNIISKIKVKVANKI